VQYLSKRPISGASRTDHLCSPWVDERVWPSYVAAASLLILILKAIWISSPLKRLRGQDARNELEVESSTNSGYIAKRGGVIIFLFKLVRLLGVLALFSLTLVTAVRYRWRASDIALVATLVRPVNLHVTWRI
jgi:hypothetical protein